MGFASLERFLASVQSLSMQDASLYFPGRPTDRKEKS